MESDSPQQVRAQLVSKCGSVHIWFLCRSEKKIFYTDTDILEVLFFTLRWWSHCWGLWKKSAMLTGSLQPSVLVQFCCWKAKPEFLRFLGYLALSVDRQGSPRA